VNQEDSEHNEVDGMVSAFYDTKIVINQSVNQFFNYRNVKTHFHMRKTQSSKIYIKSVNTYHNTGTPWGQRYRCPKFEL